MWSSTPSSFAESRVQNSKFHLHFRLPVTKSAIPLIHGSDTVFQELKSRPLFWDRKNVFRKLKIILRSSVSLYSATPTESISSVHRPRKSRLFRIATFICVVTYSHAILQPPTQLSTSSLFGQIILVLLCSRSSTSSIQSGKWYVLNISSTLDSIHSDLFCHSEQVAIMNSKLSPLWCAPFCSSCLTWKQAMDFEKTNSAVTKLEEIPIVDCNLPSSKK